MSRRTFQARKEAVEKWPSLTTFLSATVHGSDDRRVECDVSDAIGAMSLNDRIELTREWWAWNASDGAVADVRFAVETLDANILFADAGHARNFMNGVYDALIASVRRELGREWRP